MLTELTSVADAGVQEVDAGEAGVSRADCKAAAATGVAAAGVAAAGAAVTAGGRGDNLDNGQLWVGGRQPTCAPCTVEKAERRPPFPIMPQSPGRVVSMKNLTAMNFMVGTRQNVKKNQRMRAAIALLCC